MKKLIVLLFLANSINAMSLENSLIESYDLEKENKTKIKKYDESKYSLLNTEKGNLKIKNDTNIESVILLVKNKTDTKKLAVLINPHSEENIKIELGNYNIKMYYSKYKKNFIDFDNLFGDQTVEKNLKGLVSIRKYKTYKQACKGKFTWLSTGEKKEQIAQLDTKNRKDTYWSQKNKEYGECIEDASFIIR